MRAIKTIPRGLLPVIIGDDVPILMPAGRLGIVILVVKQFLTCLSKPV
jgi:hypothetical protein